MFQRYEQEHREALALAERKRAELDSVTLQHRLAVQHVACHFFTFASPRWTSGKHFVMEIPSEGIEALIQSVRNISDDSAQASSQELWPIFNIDNPYPA
jgi:hypothetical protein